MRLQRSAVVIAFIWELLVSRYMPSTAVVMCFGIFNTRMILGGLLLYGEMRSFNFRMSMRSIRTVIFSGNPSPALL